MMALELEVVKIVVSRTDFFEEWIKHSKPSKTEGLFSFLLSKHDLSGATGDSLKTLRKNITRFSSKIDERWKLAGKKREDFFKKYAEWLQGTEFTFEVSIESSVPSSSAESLQDPGPGRPRKEFLESSLKTKRRRVDDLIHGRITEELMYAAEVSARSSGKRNIAQAIKNISEPEPTKTEEHHSVKMSSDEALAHYIDSKLTSSTYKLTRKVCIKNKCNVFPSIDSVRQSKIACFPPEQKIVVTETRAGIQLQAVLDKTAERLVSVQEEVLNCLLPRCSSFTLISKWGCDGSSGHSTYKQKFTNSNDTDEYLFVFTFVPIRLCDDLGNIVWQNPRPSSTNLCRPIKCIFSKETKELTVAETNTVLDEINKLLPTICKVKGTEIQVKHEMLLTMVDGKVCNTLTDTSSAQKCFICGATPKLMNDESRVFSANQDNLSFGLSTLHAWIRCFECLLHISYRLDIKKWQARSDSDKTSVKQRSDSIRNAFKIRMGLIVDKPKPGSGNTNDGNTARRFFENPELCAEITGLDVSIIKEFGILLRALSSGYEINIVKLEMLTGKIRQLYLKLYPWYYMPATVHKLLIHGPEIVKSALLPIGQLSEEAQEARNKDLRRFRHNNTRKQSREATNRDLLNMLLITSDPVINSLRQVPQKKTGSLDVEVLDLLIAPSYIVNNVNTISTVVTNGHDYSTDDSPDEMDE